MERKINGKPFDLIRKELEAPFTELVADSTKNFLSPSIEQVEERLSSVLGLNYSFELIGELTLVEVNGKRSFYGIGIITVKDDDGNVVQTMTQSGGSDVIVLKKDGDKELPVHERIPKDLSNDCKIAVSDIKKKCAEGIGVGAYLKMATKRREAKFVPVDELGQKIQVGQGVRGKQSNSAKSSNDDSNLQQRSNQSSIIYPFSVKGKPVCRGKAIRIPTTIISSGEVCEFLVWESLIQGKQDIHNMLMGLKAGNSITCSSSVKSIGGKAQCIVDDVTTIKIA